MKTFLSVVVLATFVMAATLSAQKFDITGDWAFEVQTEAGAGSPTFSLKQAGDKVTGKYKGTFGEADVNGTVSGKTFKLAFNVDAQGTALAVSYDGEFESATSVKGKVDLGGLGSGTFTGKKVK